VAFFLCLTTASAATGQNILFTTPRENFIRLINRNNRTSSISVESVDRQNKVFADWYESVCFGINFKGLVIIQNCASAKRYLIGGPSNLVHLVTIETTWAKRLTKTRSTNSGSCASRDHRRPSMREPW